MSTFFNLAASAINNGLSSLSPLLNFDENLQEFSPTVIFTIGVAATLALQGIYRYTQPRWNERRVHQIGRLLLNIPYINNKFNEKIEKEYRRELLSASEKWQAFGIPFTEIPEQGLASEDLFKLMDKYTKIIFSAVEGQQISGTIYSPSYITENKDRLFDIEIEQIDEALSDRDYFAQLAKKLDRLHTYGASVSHLWNSLHQNEFGIGDFINYQVVRMVASMYGAAPGDDIVGLVTTGGTDSLMTAARIYRNWGMETYGHEPGEGIIVAPKSVHASIEKGGMASLLKIEYVDVNEAGEVDLIHLDAILSKYGKKVVMIVGSTPEFSSGCVNQIEEIAKRAYDLGCGMHVDSCLGGFIINNLDQHPTDYLKMKGVTSLSCDTHKNGLAPKGSSVLVMKDLWIKYGIYSIAGWDGGVYGTPSDAGSQPCTSALNALISMLAVGKTGYKRMAQLVHSKAKEFATTVKGFEGKLRLLSDPEVNVVAFKDDENWQMGKGAIYAFAHEMHNRGFTFNTMPFDRIHFCVTLRYACDQDVNERLETAIKQSLEAVEQSKQKGESFPGDAGMYCSLGKALNPSTTNSVYEYVENFFLGSRGASEAVKAHFIVLMNPYSSKSPYAI